MGEILSLRVEDVQGDGRAIRVVTKTDAATKVAHIKAVEDGLGLHPTKIVLMRRAEALEKGRVHLFPSTRQAGEAMSSKEATSGLQLLCRHCAVPQRITSHSARKGAATEAILAGLPMVVVQAIGLWKQAGSVEKYVGEVLRQSYPFLRVLSAAARR